MSDDDKPFNNPFAKLLGHVKDLPQQTPSRDGLAPADGRAGSPAAAEAGKPGPKERREPAIGPARAVVRMERKGRGGKEVTAVEQLGLKPQELEKWLKELKNALGCGGTIEGDTIVLQGDQRKRLPALLAARGVRRVTVS
jgi:translation initiation factor 1